MSPYALWSRMRTPLAAGLLVLALPLAATGPAFTAEAWSSQRGGIEVPRDGGGRGGNIDRGAGRGGNVDRGAGRGGNIDRGAGRGGERGAGRPFVVRPRSDRPVVERPDRDRPGFDRPSRPRPPFAERPSRPDRPGYDRPGYGRPGYDGDRDRPRRQGYWRPYRAGARYVVIPVPTFAIVSQTNSCHYHAFAVPGMRMHRDVRCHQHSNWDNPSLRYVGVSE